MEISPKLLSDYGHAIARGISGKPKHSGCGQRTIDGVDCFISMPTTNYFQILNDVRAYLAARSFLGRKKSGNPTYNFLDVGCGVSFLSMFLQNNISMQHDFKTSGIEIDPQYIPISKHLVDNLHECNALNFPDYGNYDIIHTFHIMVKPADNLELEIKIIEEAREGSLLIMESNQWHFYPLSIRKKITSLCRRNYGIISYIKI